MYVYICVCMHVCNVCTCIYVCIYACVCVCMHLFMYMFTYFYIFDLFACLLTYLFISLFIYLLDHGNIVCLDFFPSYKFKKPCCLFLILFRKCLHREHTFTFKSVCHIHLPAICSNRQAGSMKLSSSGVSYHGCWTWILNYLFSRRAPSFPLKNFYDHFHSLPLPFHTFKFATRHFRVQN